jgi:hypothetical protein
MRRKAKSGRKQKSGLKSSSTPKDSATELQRKLKVGHRDWRLPRFLTLVSGSQFADAGPPVVNKKQYIQRGELDVLWDELLVRFQRAATTGDADWFARQAKAINAFKSGKLRPDMFDAALNRVCEVAAWSQRAKGQRWYEQLKRGNFAQTFRAPDGNIKMSCTFIDPKVVEQFERERKRQLQMTPTEQAERIRKRDESLRRESERKSTKREEAEQNRRQAQHLRKVKRAAQRQKEQGGSYLAEITPAGQRLYLTAEDVLDGLNDAGLVQQISAGAMQAADRVFEGSDDGAHTAFTRACDAIHKSAKRYGWRLHKLRPVGRVRQRSKAKARC